MITPTTFFRLLVWLAFLAGASSTCADEFDTLRLKWRDIIVGTGYDTADSDVAARLTGSDNLANGYWSSMDKSSGRSYLWSDIASTTDSEHVTRSADDHGITLYLINRTATGHESLEVAFPGVLSRAFDAKLLRATDPTSDGTTLNTIPCRATGYGCVLRLPAWSMVMVRCSL